MSRLLMFLMLTAPLVAERASAQGLEDLDGGSSSSSNKKKAKKDLSAQFEGDVIREVEKGLYLKSGIGSNAYLLRFGGGVLRSGTALGLMVGNDVVDTEDHSIAWELSFSQGVHNGMRYDDQVNRQLPPQRRIQGDTRTFILVALGEYSIYPTRRIGVGVRGGGGVLLAPLLMNKQYATDQAMAGQDWVYAHQVHNTPHPIFQVGPTLEYYTKLSHFSVGLDIDVSYAIGFDLGAGGQGYVKYTF